MNSGLKNKVVLITGASGGIGSACAQSFSKEGARLALHANSNIQAVKKLDKNLDVPTLPLQANLTKQNETKELYRQITDHFGSLDVLVANAGIWPEEETPIHKMSLQRWEKTVTTDQTSVFLCAKEFFKILEATEPDWASLVIIGSTAAVFGEENHSDYSAAKAAIAYGLTRSLKNEIMRIVPRGRVNAVCPGWTKTPMAKSGLADEEATAQTLQTKAITRIGRPEEIASTVTFLASDKLASHITGETITVSGGMEGRLLHQPQDIDLSKA